MSIIKKIRLLNYRRFTDFTIEPNENINIIIGDNESGKSSVLEAIDLVCRGNVRRVESIGLDKLINIDAVNAFLAGTKKYDELPKLIVELYLEGSFDFSMNGKNNLDSETGDGIRLVCEPNFDYINEVVEILDNTDDYFPYDYYCVRFSTFADVGYSGYKKKLNSLMIDSTIMNTDYATNEFVKRLYQHYTELNVRERAAHRSSFRQLQSSFKNETLKDLNQRLPKEKHYEFGLKSKTATDFESDLMVFENAVGLDSKGTGKQVFIKTDFALERSGENVDVILLEEPENHLSPVNLRKLVQRVSETRKGQLFVTTHNSLISARLDLANLIIMPEKSDASPIMLKDLPNDTSDYFLKAPPASLVEYSLSKKSILVEGPSEFMLLDKFYRFVTGNSPEENGVHIITVRGLSFKRYLDIARLTGCKVAVVTDNDGDYETNCVKKYLNYQLDNIHVFFDTDNSKNTFERVLYSDNKELCDNLFVGTACDYMLQNKTEAAYLLLNPDLDIAVPDYIKRAIEWIKE